MTDPCFECGQPAECDHHVVPQSRGGTKTVPLRGECHAKAHHRDKNMSTRKLTKDALAALKAKGVKLGASLPKCRTLTAAARARGLDRSAAARKDAAVSAFADLVPLMRCLRAEGLSLHAIAERLNADGQSTRRGSAWSATQVKRVLDRAPGKA